MKVDNLCFCRPIKDIADRCKELAEMTNKLPTIVKPAFMAERVQPGTEPKIQKACADFKVVRFQRSGRAIKVMSSMGAARLL